MKPHLNSQPAPAPTPASTRRARGPARARGFARIRHSPRRLASLPCAAGLVSLEVVILALGLLGGIQMVLYAGRLSQARGTVQDIAAEAARIASFAPTAAEANRQLQDFVAQANRASSSAPGANPNCDLGLSIPEAVFKPGGYVKVQASCQVSLSDLIYLQLPGNVEVHAEVCEIIDSYRSGASGGEGYCDIA